MAVYNQPPQNNAAYPGEDPDHPMAVARVPEPRFAYAASAQEEHLARSYALNMDPVKAYMEAGYPPLRDRSATRSAAYRLLGRQRLQERVLHLPECLGGLLTKQVRVIPHAALQKGLRQGNVLLHQVVAIPQTAEPA